MNELPAKYRYGFRDEIAYVHETAAGLTEETVRQISKIKNEPEWMLKKRLQALKIFRQKPMPAWGADLSGINFDEITYYRRPSDKQVSTWDMVPENIKKTFDKIGIPEAEKKFLAGASAQYESEVVYHSVKREWEKQGVIFTSMDEGLKKYPDMVQKYFGTVVPSMDNKFAALNTAVWSGGSFVYVPPGVHVSIPLQAYFRINAEKTGQFERTLIITDKGSKVHYVEGCSAPVYSASSLHSAVVELIAMEGSHLRYTTIQNWSDNVYNLVTKRAVAYKNAYVEWLDGNIGSQVTMKFPCVILKEPGARGEVLSVAYAREKQHQDAGAKMFHLASDTSSRIISKSISKDGGRTSYRGLVQVSPGAKNSKVYVSCDALIMDEESRSDTYPYMRINEKDCEVQHEATVEKLGEEKLFYLASRGIKKPEAESLLVNGFIEPVVKEIPLEYSIELNRLIKLEMAGSVG